MRADTSPFDRRRGTDESLAHRLDIPRLDRQTDWGKRYPRISKESLLPVPSNRQSAISEWYEKQQI